jgi:hypothetical protein
MILYLALQWLSLVLMVVAVVFLGLTVWTIATMNRSGKVYVNELKPPKVFQS